MRKGYLIGAVILLGLSVACITTTVVQVVLEKYGMRSMRFWGAIAFHLVTGLLGAVSLAAACPARQQAKEDEEQEAAEEERS